MFNPAKFRAVLVAALFFCVALPVNATVILHTFEANTSGNDPTLSVSGEFTADDNDPTVILSISVDYNSQAGQAIFDINDFLSLVGRPFPPEVALRGIIGQTAFFDELEFFDFSLIQSNPNASSPINYTNQGPVGVPEPTILTLMGLGLAGIGFTRKKKQD